MHCIDSFNLFYLSSVASCFAICMGIIMKRIVSGILVLVMVLGLAACGGNANNKEKSKEESDVKQTSEKASEAITKSIESEENSAVSDAIKSVLEDKKDVKVIFWTGTGSANYPYLENMVNAFMEEYPNITVELSNQGAIADLTEKLTQNIVSGTTPTISNLSPSIFSEYIASDALVNLAPYYNDAVVGYSDEEKADFYACYIEGVENLGAEGTLYGFPTNKKTANILTYNKTYFDEQGWSAPKTWDEVMEYSKLIYEDTKKPGFSYDTSYADDAFKNLSQQYGSLFIDEDGNIDIDNEGSREALNFYKENMDNGYFTLPALMPSAGGNNSSSGFVKEECYMFVGSAAGIEYAVPKVESDHNDFEVGTASVPQVAQGNDAFYSKGEDYCVFSNSTAEERLAAWLLIKFMSEPENNVEWYVNTGNLPIRKSMIDIPEYQTFLNSAEDEAGYYKAIAVNAVLSVQDKMSYEKVIEKSSELSKACGTLWESVMIGGEDIESAIATSVSSIE